MKYKATFLIAACLAFSIAIHAQKLTISQKNSSLTSIFKEIKKQTGYSFIYPDDLIQKAKKVTIRVKNVPLETVLSECFKNQPLTYTIVNTMVIIKKKEDVVAEKTEDVSSRSADLKSNVNLKGRILNDSGQAIVGASINVQNSATGAFSDADGKFSIALPRNGSIRVSAVGFETRIIKSISAPVLDIQLISTLKELDKIIVIGYGSQRKRDVTGSVASISGETLKEVPAPNVIAQLKGRVAGVSVVQNSATPGGSGQIRIRGNRTIATSQGQSDNLDAPFLVLDGIPFGGNINDINPEDIANVDILKDASATAIYGSRGAGGVILITTKRGRKGKSVISYDSYLGVSEILRKYQVFNGQEYARFKEDAATYNRTNWPASAGTSSYLLTQAEKIALEAGISTNWQDLIYNRGFITNQQLNLTSGSETTQIGLSGGYFRESGIIPNQKFERYSIRATIDHKVSRFVRIGLNTINSVTYLNTPGGAGVPFNLVRLTSLAAPYNSDGTVNLFPAIGSIDGGLVSPLTLKTSVDGILARNRRLRTINNFYTEVKIINGLKYRFNLGLDYRQENINTYNGALTYTNPAVDQSASEAGLSNTESWSYNIQHLLYYDETFAHKHTLGITGLFEVNKDHFQGSNFNVRGVPADYIQNTNFGLASGQTTVNTTNTGFTEQGIISYMGRINYRYNDRFLLTVTTRVDGSSTLSPANQYFIFPSFAFGWNIMNEKFIHNSMLASNLRFRGGWGITGNRNVSPYSTLGLLSASTYNFGQGTQGQQLAYTVTALPNYSLGWQSTSQINLGLDFGFLNNRFAGTIDWYKQQTKDILLSVNLPISNGANSTLRNLGRTKGNGVEITFSSDNIRSRNSFKWSTDVNFFFNREKITELTTPYELSNKGNGWFVGQPLNVIYDYKKLGIWQLEDSVKGLMAAQTSPRQYPGQIRVEDLNNDGKIDAEDRQVIGNFQPQWEGGLTNRFSYNGFDLSIIIFARIGMKVLVPYLTTDGTEQGFPFFNLSRVNQVKTNYWTRENPTNDFPAPDAGSDRFPFSSTLAYYNGSFIKCRSINAGYEITSRSLKRSGVNRLRVYFNATNPFIIYSPFVKSGLGIDPEGNGYGGAVNVSGTGDSSAPGRQISVRLNNPSTRQYMFGVNLKF